MYTNNLNLDRPVNPPEVRGDDREAFDLMDKIQIFNDLINKLKDNIKDMREYIDEAKDDLVELECAKTDALIELSKYGYSYM
jgi:predicted  nucleic acid-binding Zn-ribbon protein